MLAVARRLCAPGFSAGDLLLPVVRPFVRVPDLSSHIVRRNRDDHGVVVYVRDHDALGADPLQTHRPATGRWLPSPLWRSVAPSLGDFLRACSLSGSSWWRSVHSGQSLGRTCRLTRTRANPRLHRLRPMCPPHPAPTPPPADGGFLAKAETTRSSSVRSARLVRQSTSFRVHLPDARERWDVVSNPQSAARFLSYPGAKELTENPKIVALARRSGNRRADSGAGGYLDSAAGLSQLIDARERPRARRSGEVLRVPAVRSIMR